MARYIDADEVLIELVKRAVVNITHAKKAVDSIPTADVVEIVRCKDCEHYAGDGMYCAWNIIAQDNGFCHCGERRKDGEIHKR